MKKIITWQKFNENNSSDETNFNLLVSELTKKGIKCNVKLHDTGEIDIELGMFYPDELADEAHDVIDELKLPNIINISAESYGDMKIVKFEKVNGGAGTHNNIYYLDDENFNEAKNQKLKSHEIKNIAIKMITSSIEARIGEGGAFSEFSEEDADRIKEQIDTICYSLEKKIKK